MINFKRLNITSFKSIFKLDLNFDDLNKGLYSIEGQNNTVNFAKSNGSGKSTMLDALAYTIYGTTLGIYIKKEEYQNKNTKIPLKLVLDFNVNGADYKIERTLDSVKFWKYDEDISELTKTETEKKILNVIGLTKEEFFNFTYLTQSGSNFLSKTASEKFMAIRDFIFGDEILIIKNKIDGLIKIKRNRQNSIREKQQNLKGQVSGLENIQSICADENVEDLDYLSVYIQSLNELKNKQKERQQLKQNQDNLSFKFNRFKTEAEKIKQKYESAKNNICPTCKQHLIDDTVIQEVKREASDLKQKAKECKIELKNINNRLDTLSDVSDEIDKLDYKIKKIQLYTKQKEQQKDVKEKIKQIREIQNKLETEEIEIEKQINQLIELQKYFNTVFIHNIQNAFVSELENYLNLYCYDVFDADFKLSLNGNSLDLFVDDKPYAYFSGGERQRIDLLFVFAIKIALFDFTDKCTNLLILDESLSGSDSLAYDNLIELIADLSDSANIKTLLVSHREINNIKNKIIISRYDNKTELNIID